MPRPLPLAPLLALCLVLAGCHRETGPCLPTVSGRATDPDAPAAIGALLQRQAADWNRGDLDAFATGYKNSPDILFVGSRISHGYDQLVEGYRKAYPTAERMGRLTFSHLDVQPIDDRVATATGHFHLDRSPAAGGIADGYFLLVLEKAEDGWKIIRDDTTAAAVVPATGNPR